VVRNVLADVPGDFVLNATDGSIASVVTVDSATQITHTELREGTNNVWAAIAEDWLVRASGTTAFVDDSKNIELWRRDRVLRESNLDATTATNLAAQVAALPTISTVQSFTITAPTILNGDLTAVPLWHVCAFPERRYIRIKELLPDAGGFGVSLDEISTFALIGCDYDHARRSLSVEVERLDRRMDVQLRIAGITKSDSIRRGS
jgi:hypothetical protein